MQVPILVAQHRYLLAEVLAYVPSLLSKYNKSPCQATNARFLCEPMQEPIIETQHMYIHSIY